MIFAARALRDLGVLDRGRVGLVFVPDEETAGSRGSRDLAARGLLGADGVGLLTPEPTDGIVWNANRGAISLRVTVHGKHAHVGRQPEGVNAFEGMLAIAGALAVVKRGVEGRRTAYGIEPDGARHSILMLGGRVEGGTNCNVVPDARSFTVDRRLSPEEDLGPRSAAFSTRSNGRRVGPSTSRSRFSRRRMRPAAMRAAPSGARSHRESSTSPAIQRDLKCARGWSRSGSMLSAGCPRSRTALAC